MIFVEFVGEESCFVLLLMSEVIVSVVESFVVMMKVLLYVV